MMQPGRVLLSTVAFLFYTFSFEDLVTAIDGLSPSLPLYPLLRTIPWAIGAGLLTFLIYFGATGDKD